VAATKELRGRGGEGVRGFGAFKEPISYWMKMIAWLSFLSIQIDLVLKVYLMMRPSAELCSTSMRPYTRKVNPRVELHGVCAL